MKLVDQNGRKVYSDTEEFEKEMLGIAQEYPEDSSQDFIAKDSRYTVNNTFSSVRRNLLNWYNFKENASVLEIGAGMGALTGLLCDKCAKVVALEMSEKRAEVIKARYPERKNLSIVCDDIFEWKSEEKFDYVVIVGVLEYAGIFCKEKDPFAFFLRKAREFLKKEGKLLLAIENRFGLKYWCGASEDHICKPFVGISGYREPGTAVTFSKNDLEELFEKAGYSYRKFYYVLPDYKFPTIIYTDDYSPSASAIQKLVLSYVKGSVLVYDERLLYKDIIDNNLQDFFANSFLVEASLMPGQDVQPIYVAAKGESKKTYRTSTLIYADGHVEKIPMHEDAKKHLDQILENENKLRERGIDVLESKLQNNKIIMPFYTGITAEEKFHELLADNNSDKIIELFNLLKQELLKSSEITDKNIMVDISPDYEGKDFGIILQQGYIDMVFSNCFLNGSDMLFFDQEWCFENIPLKFIIWYALRQSYLSFEGKTDITLDELYRQFDLDEMVEDFIQLEHYLWDFLLYRQMNFYDADGWYNHNYNDLSFEKKFEEYQNNKLDLEEKIDYIIKLERVLEEKNEHIIKLEQIIKELNETTTVQIKKKIGLIRTE